MNGGLLLQFQFLNTVDQPVFVYIFPVPGPPITVVWYFCTQTRHSTSSVFKIDLFRQVLFFVIILCSGRAGRYRYELGYDGPDRWFIMRRVATSPIAAPASDRVPPSNLWDAAFSGLQSEWHALLRIPCAPGVILSLGNGVEIPAWLTCCGRKTKD
jgi:hypothetical protein